MAVTKTSFQRKGKNLLHQIPGTKPSIHNNQLLVSTGVSSLDAVLGGEIKFNRIFCKTFYYRPVRPDRCLQGNLDLIYCIQGRRKCLQCINYQILKLFNNLAKVCVLLPDSKWAPRLKVGTDPINLALAGLGAGAPDCQRALQNQNPGRASNGTLLDNTLSVG